MKYVKLLVCATVLSTVACATVEDETTATVRQASENSDSQGVIYPIQVESTTGKAVIDSMTGKPKRAWDGTKTQLKIADTYAQCLSDAGMYQNVFPPSILATVDSVGGRGLGYSVLGRATSLMKENVCYSETAVKVEGWLKQRQTPNCNRDDTSGVPLAAFSYTPQSGDTPAIAFRNWSIDNGKLVPASRWFDYTTATDYLESRAIDLTRDLFESHVYLCIATKLHAQLEEGDIFTLDNEEHAQLLAATRETAQTAMLRLGVLAKVAGVNGSTPSRADPETGRWPMLRAFFDRVPTRRNELIANFLRATRLASQSSMELATFLERQAGARWTTSNEGNAFERDWGPDSARSKLMALVFGGNVLEQADALYNPRSWFPKLTASSDDPRVTILLGLAAKANALRVCGSFDTEISISGGWEYLYSETEAYLRELECTKTDAALCTREEARTRVPAITETDKYLLFRDYGISLQHAETVSRMLYDAVVKGDVTRPADIGQNLFHLAGAYKEAQAGDCIDLDPSAKRLPTNAGDYSELGMALCQPPFGLVNYDYSYTTGCLSSEGSWYNEQPDAFIGAHSALVFAREALFELSNLVETAVIGPEIRVVLEDVERMTGSVTIALRGKNVDIITPQNDSSTYQLVTKSGYQSSFGVKVAALDPAFSNPFWGVSRATLDAISGDSAVSTTENAVFSRKRFSWRNSSTNPFDVKLVRATSGADVTYHYLAKIFGSTFPLREDDFGPSATVAADGWFMDLVERITTVQDTNWSRPQYDGFGLSMNWVPPADASLMGGNAGEESYQDLLRSAKTAAEEATNAVKTAIDKLAAEAQDESALSQAETRAQAIGTSEVEALCGSTKDCVLPTERLSLRWDAGENAEGTRCAELKADGGPDVAAQKDCLWALNYYDDSLPDSTIVPSIVVKMSKRASPSFDEYAGTELQRVLVRQWNALRLLNESRGQGERMARAFGAERAAERAAKANALDKKQVTDANVAEMMVKATAENEANANVVRQMKEAEDIAEVGFDAATRRVRNYCEQNDMFGGSIEKEAKACRNRPTSSNCGDLLTKQREDTHSAANLRCSDASIAYFEALEQKKSAAKNVTDAEKWLNMANDVTAADKELRLKLKDEAESQYSAACRQYVASLQQGRVQVLSQSNVLLQTTGELTAALVEQQLLRSKASAAIARGNVELDLAKSAYATNAGLRRKYRSYDMWRARALLESARRLTVAARRSIESRFVVDLSTLNTEQAFVSAPSIWADEVYESDLNAPEVVGLTFAPAATSDAIYPNKLIDYVGNLERFVQGYTITYPTSVSLPDTEIISLAGPELVEPAAETSKASLDPSSSGWRFYCPLTNTWISHPGFGEYPYVTQLSSACNGSAPTLAKIGFALDPWGTLNGAWSRPKYQDRHNVRWRKLAVNLVGTGIRDCSRATDSMSCYTNPFIRFNLTHAGPSWQTNYGLEWRALDLSTAYVEGGKALAAEEWLEPITNSWNTAYVSNVARGELFGRPAAGNYELVFEVTPDVRLDRIERVQLLVEQDYWVRQSGGSSSHDDSITSSNVPAPTIVSFSVDYNKVCSGGTAKIRALFTNGIGKVSGIGVVSSGTDITTPAITADTTYKLTVTNSIGETEEATVSVAALKRGVFTETGAPPTYVRSDSPLTLPNGDALFGAGDSCSIYKYDFALGKFVEVRTKTGCNWRQFAPLSGGNVLVTEQNNYSFTTSVYSASTGQFTPTGVMSISSRCWPRSVYLPATARLLITGGDDCADIESYNTAELFVPSQGTGGAFSLLTMQAERAYHSATVLSNGNVLVAGGWRYSDWTVQSSAEIYDAASGATGAFVATGSMPMPRAYHGSVLMKDGRVLIAGGSDNSGVIYNPTTSTFTQTSNALQYGRTEPTLINLNDGRVVVISGGVPSEVFDPTTNTFSVLGTASKPINGKAATLSNGVILLVGSWYNSGATTHSAELFCP